jgi:hypothetical protein
MPLTIARLTQADAPEYRSPMLQAYEVHDAFTSIPQERAAAPASLWLERVSHPQGLSGAFGAWESGQLVGTLQPGPQEDRRTQRARAKATAHAGVSGGAQTAGSYVANHCASCGALQGDFFQNSEPEGPFFGGQTPSDAVTVRLLEAGEYEADASYAY